MSSSSLPTGDKTNDSNVNNIANFIEKFNQYSNSIKSILHRWSPNVIKKQMKENSIIINNNFPYASMLCRSHDQELKFLVTATIAYQTRKFGRRIFFFSTLSAFLLSSSAISLVQYKWLSKDD